MWYFLFTLFLVDCHENLDKLRPMGVSLAAGTFVCLFSCMHELLQTAVVGREGGAAHCGALCGDPAWHHFILAFISSVDVSSRLDTEGRQYRSGVLEHLTSRLKKVLLMFLKT